MYFEDAPRREVPNFECTGKEETNDAVSVREVICSASKATSGCCHDAQGMTKALLTDVPPDDSVSLLALRPDTPERGRAKTRDDSERARIPIVKK